MADLTLISRKYVFQLFATAMFGLLCTFTTLAEPLSTNLKVSITDSTDAITVIQKPYLTQEYEVDTPGSLKIFTVGGNIDVEASSSYNKVRIELYVDRGFAFWSQSKNLDNYRITTIKRDDEIVASVEQKKREQSFFGDRMNFSFKIYMPKEMSTQLKTLGGDISLRNVSGRQMMKTGGGSISISDIKGRLEAYTAGGNIDITNSRGTIYAQTQGGHISLDRAQGEMRLKSNGGRIVSERTSGTMLAQVGGGDIWADFVQVGKGINLETSAGNIHLEVPDHRGYELSLSGSEVEFSDAEDLRGEQSKGRIEGTYKDSGPPIDLNTNVGTITLTIK